MRSAEPGRVRPRDALLVLALALAGCQSLHGAAPTGPAPVPAPVVGTASPPPAAATAPRKAAPVTAATAPVPAPAPEPTPAVATPVPAPAAPEAASPAAPEPEPEPVPPAPSAEVRQAFEAAVSALRAGNTEEARRGFEALSHSHPELGGPHANLGLIARRAGRLPESVAQLEQAVKLSPRQPVYYNQLGITYRQLGNFGKALDAYKKAIALDPRYSSALLNVGILQDIYLHDPERALDFYQRYLALLPAGDERVTRWIADLKNQRRQRDAAHPKEQP